MRAVPQMTAFLAPARSAQENTTRRCRATCEARRHDIAPVSALRASRYEAVAAQGVTCPRRPPRLPSSSASWHERRPRQPEGEEATRAASSDRSGRRDSSTPPSDYSVDHTGRSLESSHNRSSECRDLTERRGVGIRNPPPAPRSPRIAPPPGSLPQLNRRRVRTFAGRHDGGAAQNRVPTAPSPTTPPQESARRPVPKHRETVAGRR
jgi:hypothetical protein